MKISEILHEAADVYLWDGVAKHNYKNEYSCDAVQTAAFVNGYRSLQIDDIKDGLKEMGLNTNGFGEFSEYITGVDRQSARHNWLKFAAMIAEEQGV